MDISAGMYFTVTHRLQGLKLSVCFQFVPSVHTRGELSIITALSTTCLYCKLRFICKGEVKGKVVPVLNNELILNRDTRWR
jgi:hypothetical protein